MRRCDTCSTPLSDDGQCVTCAAEAEGFAQVTRTGYAAVREVMGLLELEGLGPEMEKVPPGRPEEAHHPLWNLYVPRDELERARALLQRDWADLLDDPDAAAAAERGLAGVDLDAGGEITCPACGHRFAAQGSEVECPECGLGLGAPADASPDEKA